jgi:hypothetical protein
MQDQEEDETEGELADFEEHLGLAPGFLVGVAAEDDWSFVIKTHAMIEAAVSQMLAEACGKPEWLGVFSRLSLGDTTSGKLAFVKAIDWLHEPDRRFIRKLSEIRNDLVHNVSQTKFSLESYVQTLDSGQLRTLTYPLWDEDGTIVFDDQRSPGAAFVRENAKIAILTTVSTLLGTIAAQTWHDKKKNEILSLLSHVISARIARGT